MIDDPEAEKRPSWQPGIINISVKGQLNRYSYVVFRTEDEEGA